MRNSVIINRGLVNIRGNFKMLLFLKTLIKINIHISVTKRDIFEIE